MFRVANLGVIITSIFLTSSAWSATCYERQLDPCQLMTLVGKRQFFWCWSTTGEYVPAAEAAKGSEKSTTLQCGRLQGDPDLFKPQMIKWFVANGFTLADAIAAVKKLGAGSPCGSFILDESKVCGEP